MRTAASADSNGGIGDEVEIEMPEGALPAIVRPLGPGLACDSTAVARWMVEHRDDLEQLLAHTGAILFRNFAVRSTEDFAAMVAHYPGPAHGYSGGATARSAISGRVFEATRSPPDVRLMLHQEMAYLPRWPRKLAFYCRQPSATGGETIIADVRRFEQLVDGRMRDEVAANGVLYVRNFRSPGPFPEALESTHRTWQEAFYTDDPRKAEQDLREMGMTAQWLDDGSLSASYRAEGFINHPLTGERRWFNHIASQTMTPQSMRERWTLYADHYADGRSRPYDVRFGDGRAIPLDNVIALFPLLDSVTMAFPWQEGDVLMIDNVQTFHGRNPFTGHRDVQVALIEEGVQ